MTVLDEPLSALDASVQAQVANLLAELARELRVGMLLINSIPHPDGSGELPVSLAGEIPDPGRPPPPAVSTLGVPTRSIAAFSNRRR